MLPASNKGVGMNIGFPDVCLTPVGPVVVPIPYPNFAMNVMAAPFSPIVKVTMMPALNMASKIPMTMGDEPGVAHPMFKQMGAYTMGNPIVYVDKLPAINLLCPTTGNNMNDALGAVLVPSVTNVLYTFALVTPEGAPDRAAAPRSFDRRMSLADLEQLEQRLEGPGREPVRAELLRDGVGYLAIHVFSAAVPALVYSALQTLEAAGARRLLLDLRGNPGGELHAFLELAGDFLPLGALLVTMEDTDGDRTAYRSRRAQTWDHPLGILIDRGTASAAELFAGCLHSHGRAVLVGETTYGKGAGQRLVPAQEGLGAHATTAASFTLPHGEEVEGCGVSPDIEARLPEDQLALALAAVLLLDVAHERI
jgi:carboxyl-terminal processing protease